VLQRLWKPWFVYRPSQVVRRGVAQLRPRQRGNTPLRASWGADIIADPTRTIGYSILTTGLHDLAVSEALFRLISPGDTVVDAGANVGYMTVLAGLAAGPTGRVLSFEPHPALCAVLERNVAEARAHGRLANVETHQAALGDQPGTASLHVPLDFDANDGVSRIEAAGATGGQSLPVRVATLDDVLGDAPIAVLKLDVEGFEPQALAGAARALAARRITHIVYEDHSAAESDVAPLLRAAGYRLFSLGWSMRGLRVEPIERGALAAPYEAPSFIATVEPEQVLARCGSKGWLALRDQGLRPKA
jgi:FkbM family methyltransferase